MARATQVRAQQKSDPRRSAKGREGEAEDVETLGTASEAIAHDHEVLAHWWSYRRGLRFQRSYLLTVSHSGRGVFETRNWERVARDSALAYPENGYAVGIGPIGGQVIAVSELDSEHPIQVSSPGGEVTLHCESSGIEVVRSGS